MTRESTEETRAKNRAYSNKWRANNLELARERARASYWKHRDRHITYGRLYWRNRRVEAIKHYGGKCVCCGEETIEFLSLDHINDDGAAHRQEHGTSSAVHRWLKNHNYPEGVVQVMCYNCNAAKSFVEGGCPHARQTI
jgi:hypothetical protein